MLCLSFPKKSQFCGKCAIWFCIGPKLGNLISQEALEGLFLNFAEEPSIIKGKNDIFEIFLKIPVWATWAIWAHFGAKVCNSLCHNLPFFGFFIIQFFSNFESKLCIIRGQKIACLLFPKKSPFWSKLATLVPYGVKVCNL